MGKYIRKQKLNGDVVAVIDVSQSSTGVRTRATTLALQKLQSLRTTAAPSPEQHLELSYLQLRSRKLEKPPLKQPTCCTERHPNPSSDRLVIRSGGSGSAGSGSNIGDASGVVGFQIKAEGETEAHCVFGAEEAYVGENNVDFDGNEREITPCSFTRDSNDSITPGSSSKHTIISNSIQRIMPSAQEIEAFFARHAQEQRLFFEKYNFDFVNEKPLQGRYEWVRVQP
ncbi:hypothetical protein R6Q59_032716 [Mikania micrantha]|uniref:Cyclin-dependent kinase inhibitor domain-containing protein n=1 Tax=Mikania micrantha TaxID=192012 RepID=A0A5N6NTD6_9ASTR|nr:hypothetical protein E3N88_17329 [Mikania micrantha]